MTARIKVRIRRRIRRKYLTKLSLVAKSAHLLKEATTLLIATISKSLRK